MKDLKNSKSVNEYKKFLFRSFCFPAIHRPGFYQQVTVAGFVWHTFNPGRCPGLKYMSPSGSL
ncbi:MAG: hypothetical protein JW798_18230 [Prolixibacteraceae bacterium]|nr:hypothetical protein [Prolixibacteraceae bacterium]